MKCIGYLPIWVITTTVLVRVTGLVQRPSSAVFSSSSSSSSSGEHEAQDRRDNFGGLILPWYEHNEIHDEDFSASTKRDQMLDDSQMLERKRRRRRRRRRKNHQQLQPSSQMKTRSRHHNYNNNYRHHEAPAPQERIFGGWDLNPHEFPWMVKIKVRRSRRARKTRLYTLGTP